MPAPTSFIATTLASYLEDVSNDFEHLLVTSAYTFDPDDVDVADVVASEVSVASTRADCSFTVTADGVNNRTLVDSDDFGPQTLPAGETVGGMWLYENVGDMDADSPLIHFVDITDTPTNGGDLTIQLDSLGFASYQNA